MLMSMEGRRAATEPRGRAVDDRARAALLEAGTLASPKPQRPSEITMAITHPSPPVQRHSDTDGTRTGVPEAASRGAPPAAEAPAVVGPIRRRRVDLVLVAVGAVAVV